MSLKHFAVIFMILAYMSLSAQKPFSAFTQKLADADSVVLVSHANTNPIREIDPDTGKEKPPPYLLVRGKPNQAIIFERTRLSDSAVARLGKIITAPRPEVVMIDDGKCFEPHHAILIFKGRKTSYLDICFSCNHFISTKDIRLSDDWDESKWQALRAFFQSMGLTYELSSTGQLDETPD